MELWPMLAGVGGVATLALFGLWMQARAHVKALGRELLECRAEAARREARIDGQQRELSQRMSELAAERAGRELERRVAHERLAELERARQAMTDAFKALSAEALRESSDRFLQLAQTSLATFQEGARGDLEKRQQAFADLVAPVKESLQKLDSQLHAIEATREGAYQSLRQQVSQLAESERRLRSETATLATALKSPVVRGRWGEVQLRRVVELAGMLPRCDFLEQETYRGEEGALRPDLVVRLPAGKSVVVDAKAPLSAYLEAHESTDPAVRDERLREHARQLRAHIQALSKKSYSDAVQPSPEFVVLFLPGEAFFGAALEQDPSLLEYGNAMNVMIASPTSLITLLRAVAHGWREEAAAQGARQIRDLGAELYKRLADLGQHVARLGKAIGHTVEHYNKAVGALESRVLVTGRKLKELEAAPSDVEIPGLSSVDLMPRPLPHALAVGEDAA